LNYQVTFATGYSYNSNVWIDYNDDGDFNDPGELVGSAESLSTNPTTLTIPISISGAAPLGVHRMRLGTADSGQLTPNPCYGSTYGVTIDLNVEVMDPVEVPSCVTTSVPADAATGISRNSTLSWGAASGFPASYDLYLGTTPTPGFVTNLEGLSYKPAVME